VEKDGARIAAPSFFVAYFMEGKEKKRAGKISFMSNSIW